MHELELLELRERRADDEGASRMVAALSSRGLELDESLWERRLEIRNKSQIPRVSPGCFGIGG